MRTRPVRLAAFGACAVLAGLLCSAAAAPAAPAAQVAAGSSAGKSSVINREKTSPGDTYSLLITVAGIEAAVRRYAGVSASTRVVVAQPVVHGRHATVSVERYAGPLAGEGETLVLDRVNGRWQVVSGSGPDWVNWSGVSRRPGASVRVASSSATARG